MPYFTVGDDDTSPRRRSDRSAGSPASAHAETHRRYLHHGRPGGGMETLAFHWTAAKAAGVTAPPATDRSLRLRHRNATGTEDRFSRRARMLSCATRLPRLKARTRTASSKSLFAATNFLVDRTAAAHRLGVRGHVGWQPTSGTMTVCTAGMTAGGRRSVLLGHTWRERTSSPTGLRRAGTMGAEPRKPSI